MNNVILNTFDLKDKNIIFDGKLEKIEYKGRKCFFYYAKLIYTPEVCPNCNCKNIVALFKKWKTQKGIVKYLLDQDDSLNDAYQYINQLRFKLKHNDYEGFIHELKHMPLSQTHSVVQRAIKTLNKHVYFIKNTFDYYNLSNGPLEGINNKIKLIKRTSFGYGRYNHLRNRILLCSNKSSNL